jgi:hypothetical protein
MKPLEPTRTKPGVAGRLRAPHGAPSPPVIRRRPGRHPLRLQPAPGRPTRDRSSAAASATPRARRGCAGRRGPDARRLEVAGPLGLLGLGQLSCHGGGHDSQVFEGVEDVDHGPQHGSRRSGLIDGFAGIGADSRWASLDMTTRRSRSTKSGSPRVRQSCQPDRGSALWVRQCARPSATTSPTSPPASRTTPSAFLGVQPTTDGYLAVEAAGPRAHLPQPGAGGASFLTKTRRRRSLVQGAGRRGEQLIERSPPADVIRSRRTRCSAA